MESNTDKKTLIVASGNINKLKEIAQIFPQYRILSQKELGFNVEVEETGSTFAENALLKAQAACKVLRLPIIADDSGLCVKTLNGAPGIYSARYAGEHGNDRKNRKLLLENLEGKEDRTAYFECAVAYVVPDKQPIVLTGKTYGKILYEETGTGGFGYDSLFFSDDLQKSFGLASDEEKNGVSHRFRALQKLKEFLNEE